MRLALQPQGFQGGTSAVVAGAVAGADSAGVAGSTSSAAGVVAEVVAGRRPPELVVVMTGFVLFWTEVFFVYFFAVRAVKGAVFLVFWLLFGWFFGFLDFFREFCPPRHKKP